MNFQFRILEGDITYTGRELHSGWVQDNGGLEGDAAVAFFGPCDVATDDLVDLDDQRTGAVIVAARMAHVIVEHPGCTIETAVLRQRLLVCLLCEVLGRLNVAVRRDGDDVYHGDDKMTVSIAAPAPESALIHLGINVDPGGAPVAATGLAALGLDEHVVVSDLMSRYSEELDGVEHATTKVRNVD